MKRLIASALLIAPSLGNAMSGNELLRDCESDNSSARRVGCLSYIQGLLDGHRFGFYQTLAKIAKEPNKTQAENIKIYTGLIEQHASARDGLCLESNVTLGQLVDVTIKYLKEHPEERHNEAGALTFRALSLAFPTEGCNSN